MHVPPWQSRGTALCTAWSTCKVDHVAIIYSELRWKNSHLEHPAVRVHKKSATFHIPWVCRRTKLLWYAVSPVLGVNPSPVVSMLTIAVIFAADGACSKH